jgi:hypothetical protein
MDRKLQLRSEQLGMHFATAHYRLVRLVLFDLARKLDLDSCFRCQEKIVTVKELSIEHRRPWLNHSPALFWDMDNIVFAHISCGRSRKSLSRASSTGRAVLL